MREIDAELFEKELSEYMAGKMSVLKLGEKRQWKHILDYVYRLLRKQPTVNDWIPCNKDMPAEDIEVLIQQKGTTNQWIASYWGGMWHTDAYVDFTTDEVDAWRPRPESYRGE